MFFRIKRTLLVVFICLIGQPSSNAQFIFEKAEDSLLKVLNKTSSTQERFAILDTLAEISRALNVERSLKYAQLEMQLANETRDKVQILRAHFSFGKTYLVQKQNLLAAEINEEASLYDFGPYWGPWNAWW